MELTKQAVLKTLVYSDLFSYPLTKEEIWYFAIGDRSISKATITRALSGLTALVGSTAGYYFLKGQEQLVTRRLQRELSSAQKIAQAKKVCLLLSRIPTILLIGVSGSVAVGNAEATDDIDLFLITKKNTVWITRLLVLFLLELLGVRRKRNQPTAAHQICLNMLVDEQNMAFSEDRHDVYTAREILQLIPLFDRDQTYQQFLSANRWTRRIFPNATSQKPVFLRVVSRNKSQRALLSWFNTPVELLQCVYMRSHQSREVVTATVAAFHPFDYRTATLKRFQRRLKQFNLLTTN